MKWPLELALLGIAVLFSIACVIRFKISERRFNRRNSSGLQTYPSYKSALATRTLEGAAYRFARITQFILLFVAAVIAVMLVQMS